MADAVAVAGLITGAVGAVAGVAAAAAATWAGLLARRGNQAAERDRAKTAAQRRATVRPRPQVSRPMVSAERLSLTFSNAGGAAAQWHLILLIAGGVYYVSTDAHAGAIGVHLSNAGTRIADAADRPHDLVEVLASVAQDVDGDWWDMRTGELASDSLVVLLNRACEPFDFTFAEPEPRS